jgi:capsular polysaccharide biosynthesis protein
MELKQLWAVIVRRWWIIALPALVALVLAIPSFKQLVSSNGGYSVAIRFTAGQVPTADAAKTFQDQSYITWLGSEYAVNNLASWMKTQSFAQEIADKLNTTDKTFDVNALQNAIQSDSARSIMTFYVMNWPNADELKQIATAAVDVLQNKNQVYFPQLGLQRAQVIPLDTVNVTPVSTALATRLQPLFRIAIGLVAGIALAFLAEYLDPTVRTRSDIAALNLPIIAEIPHHS